MTQQKEDRLVRTRARAELSVWDDDEYAQVGDKVRMSQKVLGDRAKDEEGVVHTGTVENILDTGMRVVRFERNIAPNRKHAIMHPIELEVVESRDDSKPKDVKPDPKVKATA